MFHSARLNLTAWYLLIIMLISIFFSLTIYHTATREIEYAIRRLEFRQAHRGVVPSRIDFPINPLTEYALLELQSIKKEIQNRLIIINFSILILAGSAGYFLAGRTLRPIKMMLDEQGQFVSNASHELRTPIATLRAEMEGSLLEKNISDSKARKLIKSNLEELGTLQALTNRLLQLAQFDTQSDNSMSGIILSEIVERAVKKVAPLTNKKNIEIKKELNKEEIYGDKLSLVELFVIILDNAIKYSPKGSAVKIKFSKNKNYLEISVSDNGEGIPATDIPHIFDRFYRADRSRSVSEGYGLGLSIAQKIVKNHNGQIHIVSKKSAGTTVFIQFPLHKS